MQDKGSTDPFNFPVDQGWEQMRAQLDEVMPQKRRPFFWWWFLGLLLVGALGGYAWAQVSPAPENNAAPDPEQMERPIANINQEASEKTADPTEQTLMVPKSNAQATDGTTRLAQPGARTEITRQTIKSAVAHQQTAVDEINKPSIQELASSEGPSPTSPQVSPDANAPSEKNTDSITTSSEAPLKTRSINVAIAQLETQPLKLLPTSSPEEPVMRDQIEAAEPKRTALYVEALGGQSLVDPFPSIGAGIGLEHRLGARLRLNTGLQYQNHRTQLFDGISNPLDAEEFVWTPGAGVQNGTAYNINAAYRNLETQRINAYAQLGYRVHPRIHLGLGLQSAYIFNANATLSREEAPIQDPNGLEDANGVRVDLYDESIAAVSFDQFSNAFTAPLDVRRWQWTATSNLSYRFHRSWSVELQYLRHLTNWPAEGETFGGPHNVQLGVRYYLRK